MHRLISLAAGAGVITVLSGDARAQVAGDAAAGRSLALEVCAPCHKVTSDQRQSRRRAVAPSFRAIANTRAVTETSLHAFLSTPHPTMPNLILSLQEQDDVIAYILSLRRKP